MQRHPGLHGEPPFKLLQPLPCGASLAKAAGLLLQCYSFQWDLLSPPNKLLKLRVVLRHSQACSCCHKCGQSGGHWPPTCALANSGQLGKEERRQRRRVRRCHISRAPTGILIVCLIYIHLVPIILGITDIVSTSYSRKLYERSSKWKSAIEQAFSISRT